MSSETAIYRAQFTSISDSIIAPFQRLRQKVNRGMFTIKAECQVSLRQIPPVNRTAAKRTRRAGGRSTIRKRRLSCFGRFRSEERRVGKECVVRVALGGRCIIKKKKKTKE